MLTLPQGGALLLSEKLGNVSAAFAAGTGGMQEDDDEAGASAGLINSGAASHASSSASAASQASSSVPASASVLKPVRTSQMGPKTGAQYETYQNICVYNQCTEHKADIANQLKIRPDVHIFAKKGPQVLIIHTHTTESFADRDDGYYDPSHPTRNADRSKSVCRIGDEIAKALEANGIGVIHDVNYHDYPSYSNAYAKTLTDIQKDLKQYPSIQVVLDVHRDAIQYSDGSRAKPTAVINGKKAAQVMVVAPCEEGDALPIPDWQMNYRFGLRVQKQLLSDFPGLARPLNLYPARYNMQATHGSLLVEFGTDVNTLDEVIYAGSMFGQSLSKVLLGLKG